MVPVTINPCKTCQKRFPKWFLFFLLHRSSGMTPLQPVSAGTSYQIPSRVNVNKKLLTMAQSKELICLLNMVMFHTNHHFPMVFPLNMVDLSIVFCSRLPGGIQPQKSTSNWAALSCRHFQKAMIPPPGSCCCIRCSPRGRSIMWPGFLPPTMSTPHVASRATHRICFEDW